MKRLIIAMLCLLLLAGCATTSPEVGGLKGSAAQSVKVAKNLRIGMSMEEVDKIAVSLSGKCYGRSRHGPRVYVSYGFPDTSSITTDFEPSTVSLPPDWRLVGSRIYCLIGLGADAMPGRKRNGPAASTAQAARAAKDLRIGMSGVEAGRILADAGGEWGFGEGGCFAISQPYNFPDGSSLTIHLEPGLVSLSEQKVAGPVRLRLEVDFGEKRPDP
jgi:hypothetical protein